MMHAQEGPVKTTLKKDDVVRLRPKFEESMTYRGHKKRVDWKSRRGTVISANDLRVRVLWDGNKTTETLSPLALEKVT